MLRIHFTQCDLARTTMAAAPDPLWEITCSLHRFQTRRGRWAYAEWHRTAVSRLTERGLARIVRTLLLPAFPRAAYFPDFLTPDASREGLDAGLEAIIAAPRRQVSAEFARVTGGPVSLAGLAAAEERRVLVSALRDYHHAVIAPHGEAIQARLDAERAAGARAFLDGGVEGLLRSLAPAMLWRPPVLEVVHHTADTDVWLDGRGLRLIPTYFCFHSPVTLADPSLPQILVYPVTLPVEPPEQEAQQSLGALLGQTRAALLAGCAAGATTSELARASGISAGSVSFHTRALRQAGLITTRRAANTALHTLTPLGAALLARNRG